MKRILPLLLIFLQLESYSQSSKDYTVLLSATVQKSPPKITLNWNYKAGVTNYSIYRKLKTGTSWGSSIATLTANDTVYTDNTVQINTSYEYLVAKAGSPAGYGFINCGIEMEPPIEKGRMIALIDSNIYDSIKQEVTEWITDAEREGWLVSKVFAKRTETSEDVKTKLVNLYQTDISSFKLIFIIGHVAVPYAGNFKPTPPDGHTEHVVSWPADVFYADMDGIWTDLYVDDTSGAQLRHRNVPGDGKWDQTVLNPDNTADLQVGRVDFFNMPSFSLSEAGLLKAYFVKCHNYKTGQYKALRRGLIDDNFGGFGGEAFAASGWNNLASLIGRTNITYCDTANKADYLNTMDTASYMWSYGCGAGGYNSCSGIGTSTNFAAKNIKTVFTMLFGSYFGDWDSQNNLLRSALASGTTLTNCWSGRPRWFFHHMGLGENIGYSTKLTQNNSSSGLYNGTTTPGLIHIALMGDPTLRMHYVMLPSNLNAIVKDSLHASLSWSASGETVLGYNIYKKKLKDKALVKLNKTIVSTTSYLDSCISSPDSFVYAVRAVKLETSSSGTYYNESLEILDTLYNSMNLKPVASFTINNSDPKFDFVNTSVSSKTYSWTFSDTSYKSTSKDESRTYKKNATNWVLLTSSNQCAVDTQKMTVKVTKIIITPPPITTAIHHNLNHSLNIYPNPAKETVFIESGVELSIRLIDLSGKQLISTMIKTGMNTLSIKDLPIGHYVLEFENKASDRSSFKLIKE